MVPCHMRTPHLVQHRAGEAQACTSRIARTFPAVVAVMTRLGEVPRLQTGEEQKRHSVPTHDCAALSRSYGSSAEDGPGATEHLTAMDSVLAPSPGVRATPQLTPPATRHDHTDGHEPHVSPSLRLHLHLSASGVHPLRALCCLLLG